MNRLMMWRIVRHCENMMVAQEKEDMVFAPGEVVRKLKERLP